MCLNEVDEAELLSRRHIQGYDVNVLEAIYHVVEHFSMHTGQIILLSKARVGQDLRLGGNPSVVSSRTSTCSSNFHQAAKLFVDRLLMNFERLLERPHHLPFRVQSGLFLYRFRSRAVAFGEASGLPDA